MENNLSQKADQVLNTPKSANTGPEPKEMFVRDSILVRPGMTTMPKVPQRSFFKKPIFIVLFLVILLIVLTAIFTLFDMGRFKKEVPYVKKPLTEEEYGKLVDQLKDEGFFTVAEIEPEKLKELQATYEADERFKNPPPSTPEERQKLSENSGTQGVVQEN
jgi:hypothetical protein